MTNRNEFFDRVAALTRAGEPFAVATVVARRPPVSAHLGDRAIVFADGRMDGFVGGACSLAGYVPYARDINRGKSAPERASWLIWTLSSCRILLSYWEVGARTTIWLPLAYVIGSAFITILAYTHGKEGWGVLEQLALVVAIISSIRWIYFDQPFVTLILNVAIGFIGYFPGIKELATNRAKNEDLALEGWTLFFLGSIFNLVAVSSWTPTIAAVPIVIFVMNGVMFGLSLRNSLAQEKTAAL